MNKDVKAIVINFFKGSHKLFGKEIALDSNQPFSIDQIIKGKEKEGIYTYHIQYGYPQSGCVSMKFSFTEDEGFSIDEVTVYTQEPNQELTSINFISSSQDEEASITLRRGLECNTKPYANSDIETNPNAVKFLELALQDLEKAEILGECRMFVPEDSTIIPCTNSRPKSDNMGTMTM